MGCLFPKPSDVKQPLLLEKPRDIRTGAPAARYSVAQPVASWWATMPIGISADVLPRSSEQIPVVPSAPNEEETEPTEQKNEEGDDDDEEDEHQEIDQPEQPDEDENDEARAVAGMFQDEQNPESQTETKLKIKSKSKSKSRKPRQQPSTNRDDGDEPPPKEWKFDQHAEHPLKFRLTAAEFICELCRTWSDGPSYHCKACENYSICLKCWVLQTGRKEKQSESQPETQRGGVSKGAKVNVTDSWLVSCHMHPVRFLKEARFKCNNCNTYGIVGPAYVCGDCDYTLCLDCYKKHFLVRNIIPTLAEADELAAKYKPRPMFRVPERVHRHPFFWQLSTYDWAEYVCNMCLQSWEGYCFKCVEGCDMYMCLYCWNKHFPQNPANFYPRPVWNPKSQQAQNRAYRQSQQQPKVVVVYR